MLGVDDSEPDTVKLRITPLQSLSTLPVGFEARSYVGEIKVDKSGRFVYVSNRGHHSVAVYEVDQSTGLLTPMSIDSTLGKTPRHFGISPCGGYMVVGDQDTDQVKVFKLCSKKGSLEYAGQELDIPSPNFVLFQEPYPTSSVFNNAAATATVANSLAA